MWHPRVRFKSYPNENLVLFYYVAFWSCGCDTDRKLMHQTTQQVNKHWHGRKGWEKESNTVKRAT
jgi:hypothetical protein